MSPTLYFRLSLMMFLQFTVWGSWAMTLGTYMLQTIGFSGREVGLVYGTTALAATITPVWLGVIADRYVAAERLLCGLHLLGGSFALAASFTTQFAFFYPLILLHTLCFIPAFSLVNALGFHHLERPSRDFPRVRVWGTVAWIVINVLISYFQAETTVWPLRAAAACSFVMAFYSLTLPHTPPQPGRTRTLRQMAGEDIRHLLTDRSFVVLLVALILICIPSAYYYSFVNPFMTELGIGAAAAKMSLGQVSEIVFMLLLPLALSRMRLRWLIFIGLLAWGLRYALFALGAPTGGMAWIYTGIGLHGLAYCFTALAAQIYVDSRVPIHLRATAQGFISFLTIGIGVFFGSFLAGETVNWFTYADGRHDWWSIWMIPAGVGILTAFGFLIGFRSKERGSQTIEN